MESNHNATGHTIPRIPIQNYNGLPILNTTTHSITSVTNYDAVNDLIPPDNANHIASPKNTSVWWSIRLIYLTMFFSSISFTIVITNVYPYLRTLNRNVDKSFYGWVVAIYSVGQLLSAPFFGLWVQYRNARGTFLFALIISIVFNILYAYAYIFPPSIAIYVILLARFFVGFSFGIASVMRSFISSATTEDERTNALANLNATVSIGFLLGPVFGFIFQPIGYPGYTIPYINLRFNLYTGPGFFCSILSAFNLIFFIWFKEVPKQTKKPVKLSINNLAEETPLINATTEISQPPPFDKIAISVCLIQMVLFTLIFSSFETLVTPYSMDEFAWTNQQAVLYNNIIFVINGVLSLVILIAVKFLVKYFEERTLHIVALLTVAIGIYVFIPWPGELPLVKPEVIRFNNSLVANATEVVGCDFAKQSWCVSLPKLRPFQFWLAPTIFSLSYPMAGILLVTIFSKILGPHPTGFMFGVITSFRALGRIIGPPCFSNLYVYTGPQVTFAVIVGIVMVKVLLDLIFFTRLVPFTRRFPIFKQI